jgi:hypothetical protein
MKKSCKDPVRENRIHEEAIVDAYGPEEQAMGWYYYLENKLAFPFSATCIASKITSPLRKGEEVEVLRIAPEDACAKDMLVLVRWQGRNSPSLWHNSPPPTRTTRLLKRSPTGITGSCRDTSSDFPRLRTAPESSRWVK